MSFTPFCGVQDTFDPSKNSECVTICKDENPEEFKKCEEHFKTLPPKNQTKKKSVSRGKSFWGHINGSQAGLIDDCLINAIKAMSLKDIAEFAGGKMPRVLHHLKHVDANRMEMFAKGGKILMTLENEIFFDGNEKAKKSVGKKKTNSIQILVLRKTKKKEEDKK